MPQLSMFSSMLKEKVRGLLGRIGGPGFLANFGTSDKRRFKKKIVMNILDSIKAFFFVFILLVSDVAL